MPSRILSDLVGTIQSTFRIGTARLKVVSSVLTARNAADDADYPIAANAVDHLASDGKKVRLEAVTGMGADLTLKLPVADGSTGQALVTNASGQLSFATIDSASNSMKEQEEVIAFGTSSPITVFTPPALARIGKIKVEVETAFNGTSPSLSVGVAGDTARYMGATDNDLKTTGIYELDAAYEEDASPEAVIITYSASSSSAGSARVTVQYANPA